MVNGPVDVVHQYFSFIEGGDEDSLKNAPAPPPSVGRVMKTVRVLISGQVQGVWYRGWTQERACALGLAGWVRNLADGRVEALFHGAEPVVVAMLAACRAGPPAARVSTLQVEDWPPPSASGFHRRPTATFPDDRG